MIGFVVVAASVLVTGYGVASWLWQRLGADEPRAFERIASGVVAGVALWIAANWILAIAHLLTFTSLTIVAAAFAAAAAATLWRHRAAFHLPRFHAAILPVALWILFILWRGAIVPPLSHDALAYHLPKAVMIMQAHGYETFRVADQRIVTLPANYELLLADVLILSGTDRLTEWLGTIAYIAMLILTGAFAERWWRADRSAITASILAVAATPLFLLHSGADKNDLMTAFFCGATLLWGARWCAGGGRMPLLLAITSAALAIGTKPNGAAVAVCLTPFVLVRIFRSWPTTTFRDAGFTLVGGALAILLLGGASYIFAASSHVSPIGVQLGQRSGAGTESVTYGDWQNLWQVPYLALAEPFSRNDFGVWVPWRHEWWFWPRYEIYFSSAGPLFTVLVLLLPFAITRLRRRGGREDATERNVASVCAVLASIIVLPAAMRPLGFFAGAFIRYCAFVIPLVTCWTVVPAYLYLAATERRRLAVIATAGLALFFAVEAAVNAMNDNFAPLDYALWMRAHPGNRTIYFDKGRAASVADRVAGPNDTIAVDGAFGTWVYPAYGSHITRNVVYLTPQSTPDSIPLSARWVIVDRSWNVTWSNPRFTDMGRFWRYIGRGTPSADDVRLLNLLLRDRRFRLIYYEPRMNQAVFWRVGAGPSPPYAARAVASADRTRDAFSPSAPARISIDTNRP
jgi:hypothetical protein